MVSFDIDIGSESNKEINVNFVFIKKFFELLKKEQDAIKNTIENKASKVIKKNDRYKIIFSYRQDTEFDKKFIFHTWGSTKV